MRRAAHLGRDLLDLLRLVSRSASVSGIVEPQKTREIWAGFEAMSRRSARINQINATRFRVLRAETALAEAIEVLRTAATAPGYAGPNPDAAERVNRIVGLLREAVDQWKVNEMAAHPRVRSFIKLDQLERLIGA